jgi:hypothetical protein
VQVAVASDCAHLQAPAFSWQRLLSFLVLVDSPGVHAFAGVVLPLRKAKTTQNREIGQGLGKQMPNCNRRQTKIDIQIFFPSPVSARSSCSACAG